MRAVEVELSVDVAKVGSDRLGGHEQGLGDLAISEATSGHLGDASLRRGQGVGTRHALAARVGPRGQKLVLGSPGQWRCITALSKLERLAQRLAGGAALTGASLCRSQVAERPRQLEAGRRISQR